jgi:hypothetical protein
MMFSAEGILAKFWLKTPVERSALDNGIIV